MAINLYQSISNPFSGESFCCISANADTYTMQWTLQSKGYVPFEHIHYRQNEIFRVQKGELKVIIDGKTHIAAAGQVIVVPKGARHIASNNKEEVMDALVSYTPALDYDKFMMCLLGLTTDGYMDKKGGISIPMMGYCLKKMKCQAMARPTKIPAPAFNLALRAFYFIGMIKGWNKLYKKYTE